MTTQTSPRKLFPTRAKEAKSTYVRRTNLRRVVCGASVVASIWTGLITQRSLVQLPEEARLAHARLPHQGDDLTMPVAGSAESISHLLQLDAPADEAGEPPWRHGLETGTGGGGTDELEDIHGRLESLDRHWAERLDLDEALGQLQRRGGESRAPGRRELFHARRQMRCLANGGVVHAEIAPDRPHHDVSGIEPNTDLYLHAVRRAELVRIPSHGVLDLERGIRTPESRSKARPETA